MRMTRLERASTPAQKQTRWRWWYSAIADWMLRNPAGTLAECAQYLNKNPNTISYIVASDIFQDYLRERKEEWRQQHDFALVNKTTAIAEKALDLMLQKMDMQGDKIPMAMVTEVATSALDRLGYAPKTTPSVQVNLDQSDRRSVVMVPISHEALSEARDAIRDAEQKRITEARQALELEVEPEADQGDDPSS